MSDGVIEEIIEKFFQGNEKKTQNGSNYETGD
jgi:predicted PolB exonuclease-like 3'-5' exonuclease